MDKLFTEFESVSFEEWIKKIELDLKGKPLSVLDSYPEPDLKIQAHHHGDSQESFIDNAAARNLTKPSNSWKIRQAFDENVNNQKLLTALNEGIEAIGLSVNTNTKFTDLTKNILFEHIHTDVRFTDLETALSFSPFANMHVNFDCIGLNTETGNFTFSLDDFHAFFKKHADFNSIWVSGSNYGTAGASTIQELAFTIGHLNEYIQYLTEQSISLEEINKKISIEISINENYFVNIAKLRVIKELVSLVFKGYDANYKVQPILLYAKTNIRHLAKNDKNNNALRETTQAMSAVIGGCDVLTVDYGKYGTNKEIERFERIAKNIQLVLKEEAYLDKVIDPSGGSYFIESLTQDILEKSWALFLEIENKGGLIANIKNNTVQDLIQKNKTELIQDMVENKRTFLGVNKHPNATEQWVESEEINSIRETDFTPLLPFYLENHFYKTTANHE